MHTLPFEPDGLLRKLLRSCLLGSRRDRFDQLVSGSASSAVNRVPAPHLVYPWALNRIL